MSDELVPLVKAVRALKKEIDKLTAANVQLVRRVKALEEANLWNRLQGNLESPPEDVLVIRTAAGAIAYQTPIGETVDDAD